MREVPTTAVTGPAADPGAGGEPTDDVLAGRLAAVSMETWKRPSARLDCLRVRAARDHKPAKSPIS